MIGGVVAGAVALLDPVALVQGEHILYIGDIPGVLPAGRAAFNSSSVLAGVARQKPPNNLEGPGLLSKGRAPHHGAAVAPA